MCPSSELLFQLSVCVFYRIVISIAIVSTFGSVTFSKINDMYGHLVVVLSYCFKDTVEC